MTEMTTDIEDWVFILGEALTSELGFYSIDHDLRTSGIGSTNYRVDRPIEALEFRLHELVHAYTCERRHSTHKPGDVGMTQHLRAQNRASNTWEAIVVATTLRVGSVLLRWQADFAVFGREALRGLEISLNASRKRWSRSDALDFARQHLNHKNTLALAAEILGDLGQHLPLDIKHLQDRLPVLHINADGGVARHTTHVIGHLCLQPGPLE